MIKSKKSLQKRLHYDPGSGIPARTLSPLDPICPRVAKTF